MFAVLMAMTFTTLYADTDVSVLTNAIYAKGCSALPNNEVTLSVDMKNSAASTISGFQFSLVLPEGASYVPTAAVSSERANPSQFTLEVLGSTTLGITCYSISSATFSGTSGEVATLKIKAPAQPGNYVLLSKEGVLSQKLGEEVACADVEKTLHVHNLIAVPAKAATCTEDGNLAYWYCDICNTYFSDASAQNETTLSAVTLPATGHTYSTTPTWQWEGCSLAKAIFQCTSGDDTQIVNATVTSEVKIAATCTEKGTTTYTAKAYFQGAEYVDVKEAQDIPALGHQYEEAIWTWNGYTEATVKKVCSTDANHVISASATITSTVTQPATCTAEGLRTYTATAVLEGETLTDTKTQVISATGHTYSTTPTWQWEGYTSATATFECTSGDDAQIIVAMITEEITTPATDTEAGLITYTATVTFEDKTYVDVKTETIPANGHEFGADPTWRWSEDYHSAVAIFSCIQGDYTQEVPADVTSTVKVAATCMDMGTTTYTAKVIFQDKEYTDEKEAQDIPALGHQYGEAIWTWNGYTEASVKKVCTNDTVHVISAQATITSEETLAATCTTDGVRTYTATAILEGETLTNTQTEAVSATGHDLVITYNGNGTHTINCTKCDYCVTEDCHYVDGRCSVCGSFECPYDVVINGVYYKLDNETNTAIVTYKEYDGTTYSSDYADTITILDSLVVDGISYPVVAISDHAFDGCNNLSVIYIPQTVSSIGDYAFNGCSNLKEIHCQGMTPPTTEQHTFEGVNTNHCKLYVPTGSKESYAWASGWRDFVNIIEESVGGIQSVSLENFKISFRQGYLYISELEKDLPVYVYALDGTIIGRGEARNGSVSLNIQTPRRDLILKIGNVIKKVIFEE